MTRKMAGVFTLTLLLLMDAGEAQAIDCPASECSPGIADEAELIQNRVELIQNRVNNDAEIVQAEGEGEKAEGGASAQSVVDKAGRGWLRKFFDKLDENGSGKLEAQEINKMMLKKSSTKENSDPPDDIVTGEQDKPLSFDGVISQQFSHISPDEQSYSNAVNAAPDEQSYSNAFNAAQSLHEVVIEEGTPEVEVLIVGAGPAGLQWGTLLEHEGFSDYVILERGSSAGTFFRTYPRARRLISNNKCRPGKGKSRDFALRHDWNSLLYVNTSLCDMTSEFYPSADELVKYFEKVATNLNIEYNANVIRVSHSHGKHVVTLKDGRSWICHHLVVASGFTPEPLPAARWAKKDAYTYATFPALDNAMRADFCDNRQVIIIGNGNAAYETANLLAPCAKAVQMMHRRAPRFSALTHYVGDVRMKSFEIADRYLLKSLDSMNVYGTGLSLIGGGEDMHKLEEDLIVEEKNQTDAAVVFCGGFTGKSDSLVTSMNETVKSKFPLTGSFYSDPQVPKKWYAGNLMHGRDYRRSAGGFIHGFRYLIQAQANYILSKYYGRAFPIKRLPHLTSVITHTASRFQNSSALYQMHGVLRDVLLIRSSSDNDYVYIEQVPRDWTDDVFSLLELERPPCWCEVGFDYGHREDMKGGWDFNLMFQDVRVNQDPPLFLHPVAVATFSSGVQEHFHGPEDFYAEWTEEDMVNKTNKAVEKCVARCHSRIQTGSTMDQTKM